ncbi:putative Peptidoglycan domain protein [compost metagenome]
MAKRGKEGEKVLVRVLNIMQGQRYIEICERNPSQEQFFYGWIAKTGWIDDSNREEMIKRVIEPLAEFHEFPWCITSHTEFFDNLIKTRGKDN